MRQAQPRTTREPGAEPRLPSRYHLITPTDWFRIPLRSKEYRARSVRALVDRTYPSRDENAARRRELQELLFAMVDSAAHRNGVEDPGQPVPLPADMVADGLRVKYGEGARVTTMTLPSGPAVAVVVRRRPRTPGTSD